MALNNNNLFLQLNLPYGLQRNDQGKWRVFNRKYQSILPQGFKTNASINQTSKDVEFIFYSGLTEKFILSLGGIDDLVVKRDDSGQIEEFWLWGDGTHPINSQKSGAWETYMKKIKKLASLNYKIS